MTFSPAPPRPVPGPRRPLRALAAVCCLLPLAACGAGTDVTPPHPTGAAARVCRALHDGLPGRLAGLERQDTSPASDFTAAWGSPAIVLRCGVPLPGLLAVDRHPNLEAVEIGGVNWFPDTRSADWIMTTTGRQALVEVTVPARYAGRGDSAQCLTALAAVIRKTDPAQL